MRPLEQTDGLVIVGGSSTKQRDGTPPWIIPVVLLGIISVMTVTAFLLQPPGYRIHVAFIGNSMQYVNDLPRFMEALAGRKRVLPKRASLLTQNSCLHGSLNFNTLLKKGNGMYNKWRTATAEIRHTNTWDFGACTVRQLLTGHDENLVNYSEHYKNDGKNACFMSETYYNYTMAHYQNITVQWDYVVMNDHTKWPAVTEKVELSLQVLAEEYVPMLVANGATPVLYATHGYRSHDINVTGFGNVSYFTSNVFDGYRQYAELLSSSLPYDQQPRIAPVGLAFLAVYEEDHDMWRKLFYIDGLHPSPHGSYLMGCVLYATLYGYMPRRSVALPPRPRTLWKRARKMEINPRFYMSYPTYAEAAYLYGVAKRIMIKGHRPVTWIKYFDESTDHDFIGKWG